MDYLFSPWRFRYLNEAREPQAADCVLCANLAARDDAANLVVWRGSENAILLNLYPYTTGHLMILPYAHNASLRSCTPAGRAEMMELAAWAQEVLDREYRPQGYNLGLNLGAAAGAGIAAHLHLHVVPRWAGDANFMTVVGETRVLPEDLSDTYARLRRGFSLPRI